MSDNRNTTTRITELPTRITGSNVLDLSCSPVCRCLERFFLLTFDSLTKLRDIVLSQPLKNVRKCHKKEEKRELMKKKLVSRQLCGSVRLPCRRSWVRSHAASYHRLLKLCQLVPSPGSRLYKSGSGFCTMYFIRNEVLRVIKIVKI